MACREALGIFRLSVTFTKWHHSSQGKPRLEQPEEELTTYSAGAILKIYTL